MNRHIVTSFDESLKEISAQISEMGGMAKEQLGRALVSLSTQDSAMAKEVVISDERIDAMEVRLEETAIEVLALRQPMASDLREVVSALKIASTLERIGDLSKNIAKRAQYLNESRPEEIMHSVIRMGRQTHTLFAEVLCAYATRDTALAVSVWKRDEEIDEMCSSILRELITYMMEDNRTIGLCSQLLFVAKNLERIGDHATFIAEMTHYITEGRHLEHERPKGGDHIKEMSRAIAR